MSNVRIILLLIIWRFLQNAIPINYTEACCAKILMEILLQYELYLVILKWFYTLELRELYLDVNIEIPSFRFIL